MKAIIVWYYSFFFKIMADLSEHEESTEFHQVWQKESLCLACFSPVAQCCSSTPPFSQQKTSALGVHMAQKALYKEHFTWGAGEYAPIPPVFGPRSPSINRLWSCAGGMGATVTPSVKHKHYKKVRNNRQLEELDSTNVLEMHLVGRLLKPVINNPVIMNNTFHIMRRIPLCIRLLFPLALLQGAKNTFGRTTKTSCAS